MPIYEYQCPKCEALEQRLLPIADFDKQQICQRVKDRDDPCDGILIKQISTPGLPRFDGGSPSGHPCRSK